MKTVNNSKSDEPPSVLSPLEKTISENYHKYTEIIATVRKYSFEATLFPVLNKIDDYIKSNNYDSIPNIVGTLLTTINDQIQKASGKEKLILEHLSSELFKQQIAVLNSTRQGKECWTKCIPVLQDTCEFKNYNFEELSRLLRFDFIPIIPKSEISNKPLPYYVWHESTEALLEIIRDIKSKNWISSVPEFKKLFSPISDANFIFRASTQNIDKLIVLFSELKSRNLITPQKNKGHFHPLFTYGMDLDKKLFKKEPKKHLEAIKKNKGYYDSLLREVTKLIDSNCAKL